MIVGIRRGHHKGDFFSVFSVRTFEVWARESYLFSEELSCGIIRGFLL
jgi:hypothetical protein